MSNEKDLPREALSLCFFDYSSSTKNHFARELVMHRAQYPKIEEHKVSHQKILADFSVTAEAENFVGALSVVGACWVS